MVDRYGESASMDDLNREIARVDRISLLPDELLCRILSFLSTKDAVSTSVLSKRWNPLCLSATVLDFHLQPTYFDNRTTYVRFARFVKASIDRDPPVETFIFKLKFRLSLIRVFMRRDRLRSDLMVWLNTAVRRGIQHLHVHLSFLWNLPASIFTCKTLVVLKLKNCIMKNDFSSSVDLPSLKILHLKSVHFDKYEFLVELLNGCPVLEDLKTIYAGSGRPCSTVLGEFKCLSKLVRAYVCGTLSSQIPLEALCNAEFLRLEMERPVGPNIPVFSNVTYLELSCWYRIKWHLVVEMFNHCPKLQNFSLHKVNEQLIDELCPIPQSVPGCISSQLKKCSLDNFEGTEGEMIFTIYVLQHSSALQTMNIKFNSYYRDDQPEIMQVLSDCPRSSTTCELLFDRNLESDK